MIPHIIRQCRLVMIALATGIATAAGGAQALAPDIVVTKVINAPDIPTIRRLRTLVYLDFKPLPDGRTEVTLRNFGYGAGDDWARTKAYFENAWPAVMGSLEKRFAAKG
jgi:hypothetical protein